MPTITLSLISHTNVGKTTLARTLLRRDVGDIRDAAHVTDAVKPAIATLHDKLATVEWTKPAIAAAIKETLAAHGLKMPVLAHAARVLVCGRAQTPSLDAVLELFDQESAMKRLRVR